MKENRSLYIRFGDIPENEKSCVWNNDDKIGEEEGVSVYPAIIDADGTISIGLSLPITETTLYTFQGFLQYQDRECWLVAGDLVGRGTDNEPLIKNVRKIQKIHKFRTKENS